jgi:hypothetical protein
LLGIRQKTVDWIWASYLVSILNAMPVYAISFNFNQFLGDAEFALLNDSANTTNAFELLQNFSNREEVEIEKIINILIAAINSSDKTIRLNALKILRTIKRPLDEKMHLTILKAFKQALNHDDYQVSNAAMKGLTQPKLKFLATKPIADQLNTITDLKCESKSAMQTNIIRKNKRKVSNVTPDKKLGSPIYKRIKNLHPALNEETSTDSSIFKAVEVARQSILKEALTNSNRYLRKLAINYVNEDPLLVNSAKLYHINCLINELQNPNRGFNSEYDCCLELTEIVKKDSTYANLVIEVFAKETINKKEDYFFGTEKIFEIISEANLNLQQKNYVVYGILLYKLQGSQDRAVRFKLIKLIDKIYRFREMDYQIGIHLREPAMVSMVRHYVVKSENAAEMKF